MHFTEQTEQPRPPVFRKCWASCHNGVSVILQKYGQGGGSGGRLSVQQLKFHFAASFFTGFSWQGPNAAVSPFFFFSHFHGKVQMQL